MRILVQRTDTLAFYKGIDEWTSDPDEAIDFISSTVADRICKEHGLSHVRMVVKFDQPDARDVFLNFLPKDVPPSDEMRL